MKSKKYFVSSIVLVVLFAVWIGLILHVDVQAIGPEGSKIGFATINRFVHEKIGVHMIWYNITEVTGFIGLLTAFVFGCLGLMQLIKRKSLRKVDRNIYVLAAFYVLVVALYEAFEIFIVNYRPVLMEGELEASFPSSHTMVTICIMGTAIIELKRMIKQGTMRSLLIALSYIVLIVTVVGRLISGVHWFTDIVGGLIIGCAMILLYAGVTEALKENKNNTKNH